ncbi:MAG TPA: 2-hydroxyacyl-CoA dehydratase [Firmicutes bacterium]|nr:2-hydroxyacyl-CoA dehydratase [Bacillota bacterium]
MEARLMVGPPLDDFGLNLTKSVVRHALRTRAVSALGRSILAMRRNAFSLRSTQAVAEFALEETVRAFNGKAPTAWTSAFAPSELLRGMGLTLFSPEAASAVLSAFGLATQMLGVAEAHGHSRDTCTFHRAAMGAHIEGIFPRPDLLVAASHLCDGAPRLFCSIREVMAHREEDGPHRKAGGKDRKAEGNGADSGSPVDAPPSYPPFYLLDIPWGDTGRDAVRYVASQLESLFHDLAQRFRLPGDLERVKEAIRLSNEARKWAVAANELKRLSPCPVTAREVADYVYVLFIGFGSEEAVRIYRTLYEEASARAHRSGGQGVEERCRILWLHLRPFYAGRLWTYMEETLGARIVFDEFSNIYWDELDPDKPFESLAVKALSHPGHGPIERRARTVLRLAEEYHVDGVIHFSHWGCRQSSGGALMIKDYLKEHGVPMLILDGDCIDRRNYAEGQAMTRLEGFVEMLA